MAWETRRGRPYYYSSRRIDGRVVKRYLGTGDLGGLAAGLQAEAVQRRVELAEAMERERRRLQPADAAMSALDEACALAIEASLVAAGYHKVNYEWRRRRVRRHRERIDQHQ